MFLLFCSVEQIAVAWAWWRPVDQNEGGRGLRAECASENLSVNLRRTECLRTEPEGDRAILSGLSGGHDCGALELILILSGLSDDLNAPCHHEACVKPWHAAVWGCSELSPWWGMTAGATNLSSFRSYSRGIILD